MMMMMGDRPSTQLDTTKLKKQIMKKETVNTTRTTTTTTVQTDFLDLILDYTGKSRAVEFAA
jgi:hypothetical protein